MRRFISFSLPAVMAFAVFTAHPDDKTKTSSPDQSDTTSSQQEHLTQQQRNQQSTFDPHRVSDTELKKSVSDVNKASSFMGMSIQNLQKEKLGSVKDMVFDPESGKISYAVLSVGGFLGVGDKLVAVPLKSLRPQPGEKYLVLDMTKEELKNAPGLAKNNWPSLNDPALGSPGSSEHATGTSSTSSPSSSSSGSADKSSSSSDKSSSSADQSSSSGATSSSSDKSSSSKSSDQLSSSSSKSADSTSSKDARGSSPSVSSGSSSEKSSTSNSGKDSGASDTTSGDSKSSSSDSK
jgi:sporulation protein YlmC with PRC-barrel domain